MGVGGRERLLIHGINQSVVPGGQRLEGEGAQKHQRGEIGEVERVLGREVEYVLETRVLKTSTTVGKYVSSNVSDQSNVGVCGKERNSTERIGRLEDNQIIESKGEEMEVRRVVPVLAEIDLNSIAGGKKTGK